MRAVKGQEGPADRLRHNLQGFPEGESERNAGEAIWNR